MKRVITLLVMSLAAVMAWSQEEGAEENRKALTDTGLVFHAGEFARSYGGGLYGGGFVLNIGKRFVPKLQGGIGIMPSVNIDIDYLIDYNDDNLDPSPDLVYEHEGAYFTMPVYAWVKYDFTKRIASPFVYCGLGSQIANIKSASGGLYRSINAGCRIALQKIAISPYMGYYNEANYDHFVGGGIVAGAFVEF